MAGSTDVRTSTEDLYMAVRFEAGCWLLDSRHAFETVVYPSGGAAESAARLMAAKFARSGRDVHVSVEDRRHAVVGTKTFFASPRSGLAETNSAGDC